MVIRTQLRLADVANRIAVHFNFKHPDKIFAARREHDYNKTSGQSWEAYSIHSRKKPEGLLGRLLSHFPAGSEEFVCVACNLAYPGEVYVNARGGNTVDEDELRKLFSNKNP
jgi:hypothetical protein